VKFGKVPNRRENFMNKISVDELEQKIEAGEEVIDRYFDASTTRVGKVYKEVSRRQPSKKVESSNIEK
jgi:hypothetical protein